MHPRVFQRILSIENGADQQQDLLLRAIIHELIAVFEQYSDLFDGGGNISECFRAILRNIESHDIESEAGRRLRHQACNMLGRCANDLSVISDKLISSANRIGGRDS